VAGERLRHHGPGKELHARRNEKPRLSRLAACLDGPAVIAEDETSTFVTSRFRATIDPAGGIVLDKRA
jgi:hypothetical protein